MSAAKYHMGKFPPQALDLERLLPLIGPASSAVARYDGVLSAIPNASVLLSPLNHPGSRALFQDRGNAGNHGRGARV